MGERMCGINAATDPTNDRYTCDWGEMGASIETIYK